MRLREVMRRRFLEVEDGARRVSRGERVLTHVPTGLAPFDEVYGGLEIGVQTLLVGHTGDGKSAVVKQLLEGAARAGLGALAYVVEDPQRRTADRFLATPTGISASDIGRLRLGAHQVEQLRWAVDEADWADRVDVHFGPVEAREVVAQVRDTREVGGAPLGLVVVDYAQALTGEGGLEEVCADMARGLQLVAEARDLATVLGSQASSEVLKRGKDRYQRDRSVDGFVIGLGEEMWSRRLGQYSKCEITLLRPGRMRRLMGEDAEDREMQWHVPKANFGPSGGHVTFWWDGPTQRIYPK